MTPTPPLISSELTPAHQTSTPCRNTKFELGPRCLKASRERVVPNLDHPFPRHKIERTSCIKVVHMSLARMLCSEVGDTVTDRCVRKTTPHETRRTLPKQATLPSEDTNNVANQTTDLYTIDNGCTTVVLRGTRRSLQQSQSLSDKSRTNHCNNSTASHNLPMGHRRLDESKRGRARKDELRRWWTRKEI